MQKRGLGLQMQKGLTFGLNTEIQEVNKLRALFFLVVVLVITSCINAQRVLKYGDKEIIIDQSINTIGDSLCYFDARMHNVSGSKVTKLLGVGSYTRACDFKNIQFYLWKRSDLFLLSKKQLKILFSLTNEKESENLGGIENNTGRDVDIRKIVKNGIFVILKVESGLIHAQVSYLGVNYSILVDTQYPLKMKVGVVKV
jgi:hypothetical protein